MDTAANTGAGEPIAHALVDLDMQQWKDSQTYQAEVPSANDQVKLQSASIVVKDSGCCLWDFQARNELHSFVSYVAYVALPATELLMDTRPNQLLDPVHA